MALKAILFDLDDTLIDWSGYDGDWNAMHEPHLAGVLNHLAEQGHNGQDALRFLREFGSRTETAWRRAGETLEAPHLGRILIATAEALGVPVGTLDVDAVLRAYAWVAPKGTIAFPEVGDVLPTFKAAGLKIAIVTNAYQPMWLRDIEMAHHGLLEHFADCRISAADVGVIKPHPRIFQAALDCLGVNPQEAVFIGDDAEADIIGAQAVGMRAILRKTARYPDTSRIAADAIIHSLHDVLPVLDGWYPGWRQENG